ncbi:hypothetical protein AGMMS49975_18970 [Clostridia bacterium]|nr:hypothetical protein AGMMS49975_18970 [Clostridia bacterium]
MDIFNKFAEYADAPPNALALRKYETIIADAGNLASGLLMVLSFIAVIVGTAFDILYLNVTEFADFIDTKLNAKVSRFLVSFDAVNAVEEAVLSGDNVFAAYVKKKIRTYVVGATIFSLAFTGAWGVFLQFLVKYIAVLIDGR